MLGGGPTVTRSTTFGDSTLLEDGLKYRYAANAATRTIAVFTLGKYRCCWLAYCLYIRTLNWDYKSRKNPFSGAHSQPLSRPDTGHTRLRLRKLPNRLVSAIADS